MSYVSFNLSIVKQNLTFCKESVIICLTWLKKKNNRGGKDIYEKFLCDRVFE